MAEGGQRLTTGMALPSVTLPATDGAEIDVAPLPGRSVIAVYPWTGRPGQPNPPLWDDIPGAHGSTPELERFGALSPRFEALGWSRAWACRSRSSAIRERNFRGRWHYPVSQQAVRPT
jgi:peroxiredoxin